MGEYAANTPQIADDADDAEKCETHTAPTGIWTWNASRCSSLAPAGRQVYSTACLPTSLAPAGRQVYSRACLPTSLAPAGRQVYSTACLPSSLAPAGRQVYSTLSESRMTRNYAELRGITRRRETPLKSASSVVSVIIRNSDAGEFRCEKS